MRNAKKTYRRFVEFEELAADIYLRLASRFSVANPDLSALWLDMAMQEKQHAGLLQFCIAERFFAKDLPADDTIRKFNRLFRDMEKRAADPKISVSAAFALAVELETSEMNAIYSHLTTPLHNSSYLAKRKLVVSPANHIAVLAGEARKFPIAAGTLKTLDRLRQACPDLEGEGNKVA